MTITHVAPAKPEMNSGMATPEAYRLVNSSTQTAAANIASANVKTESPCLPSTQKAAARVSIEIGMNTNSPTETR